MHNTPRCLQAPQSQPAHSDDSTPDAPPPCCRCRCPTVSSFSPSCSMTGGHAPLHTPRRMRGGGTPGTLSTRALSAQTTGRAAACAATPASMPTVSSAEVFKMKRTQNTTMRRSSTSISKHLSSSTWSRGWSVSLPGSMLAQPHFLSSKAVASCPQCLRNHSYLLLEPHLAKQTTQCTTQQTLQTLRSSPLAAVPRPPIPFPVCVP